ncbi:unnamed protein product, partial [Sphacelaria rigidula]
VLIGYESDNPTYRTYNRETGRVVNSKNVTFIKKQP